MATLVASYTSVSSVFAAAFGKVAKLIGNSEPVPHWVDFLSPNDK